MLTGALMLAHAATGTAATTTIPKVPGTSAAAPAGTKRTNAAVTPFQTTTETPATSVSEGAATATPTPTPTTYPIGNSGGSSINPSAEKGKDSQSGGSGANMAAGAALMAACMMTQPPNIALCIMGALALAQGAHDDDASKQSAATQNASQTSTTPTTKTTASYGSAPDGKGGFDSVAITKGQDALKDAGITVTPDGVKMGDGSFKPASSFSSAAGLSAAGLDPNALKEAKKITEGIGGAGAASVSKFGTNDAAGGGSGGPGDAGENANEKPGADGFAFGNLAGLSEDARRRLMAGKTVNFDGEPIGVRGGNIFEMVHTCYQRKRAGNQFIETETTALRAPAGARPTGQK